MNKERQAVAAPIGHSALSSEDHIDRGGLPRRFGRYHLLRLLARGGMGQVFLACTTGVEGAERPVVVKVIRREYVKDPNFLARFLDEARVQSQLQHSGVAQVLEAASHEPTGEPFVVIEYVEGRSLGSVRRRIAEVGLRLGWADAVSLGALVLEGLTHIHERRGANGKPLRIVHRDLSPHNVMVGYGGEAKIIDFGTARGQNRRCHTVAGVVFAKPGYVAPEVANGDTGDFRVDLYAAGVMLWELCAGRRFLQGDPAQHMAAVARGDSELPPIASLIGAPATFDVVIAKLTAFERDERYETTREAASQLARVLSSAPALPNGERGVRARVAQLMYTLYPNQPGLGRKEFARLVRKARGAKRQRNEAPFNEQTPAPDPANAKAPADDAATLLAGSRYRLRREIGRGTSSVVYEAEHTDLGRRVAIKVLAAEHTHSRDFTVRFRREARALSRLTHSGLVRVYDFGQTADGRMFCVMELLEGHSLGRALEQEPCFDWRRAVRVAQQCSLALAVAHRNGVVHRDIKPANLFLTQQGRVKLIDFSLAKSAEEVPEGPASAGLARPEGGVGRIADVDPGAVSIFGTPEYMAPEQVAGGRVDERADVYSLGCVLYEMLTGRLPFTGKSVIQLLDAKLKGNPEAARDSAPAQRIPRSVNRVVMKALARHPGRRFQSAEQFADALANSLDEPSRRRNRRRAAGSTVFAAVMAFAVVLVASNWDAIRGKLPGEAPSSKGPQPAGAEPGSNDGTAVRSLDLRPSPLPARPDRLPEQQPTQGKPRSAPAHAPAAPRPAPRDKRAGAPSVRSEVSIEPIVVVAEHQSGQAVEAE